MYLQINDLTIQKYIFKKQNFGAIMTKNLCLSFYLNKIDNVTLEVSWGHYLVNRCTQKKLLQSSLSIKKIMKRNFGVLTYVKYVRNYLVGFGILFITVHGSSQIKFSWLMNSLIKKAPTGKKAREVGLVDTHKNHIAKINEKK